MNHVKNKILGPTVGALLIVLLITSVFYFYFYKNFKKYVPPVCVMGDKYNIMTGEPCVGITTKP